MSQAQRRGTAFQAEEMAQQAGGTKVQCGWSVACRGEMSMMGSHWADLSSSLTSWIVFKGVILVLCGKQIRGSKNRSRGQFGGYSREGVALGCGVEEERCGCVLEEELIGPGEVLRNLLACVRLCLIPIGMAEFLHILNFTIGIQTQSGMQN